MNSYSQLRLIVLRCAALLLVVFGALFALFSSVASAAPPRSGEALALRVALAGAGARPSGGQTLLAHTQNWQIGANGRVLLNPVSVLSRGAASPRITRTVAHAGGAPIIISEPVRTYDVFAPPPTFQTQQPAGPLTPTNFTPVWSSDETYLVFSSNRGGDGHFHIYSVPASGGSVSQITSGPGDEFFPVLNINSTALAFTSDANSRGDQQLYLIGGQSGVTFNHTGPAVDVSTLTNPNNEKTFPNNDFANVGRPAFSPGDGRLAFSAQSLSTSPHSRNLNHIYFLYIATNGFQPQTTQGFANPPAALTDGSGDDTNPAWSPDGRYIAFDSTAANVDNSNQQISFTTAPSTTSGGSAGGSRSIFLISGGVNTAFGTVPGPLQGAHGRVTVAGTDDFAPAWSFNTANQFFNPNGTLLYLAFARAGARNQNHDIYYFRLTDATAANATQGMGAGTITPETTGGSNPAVHQNTDDNPGAGGPNDPGNNYDDIYPAWSPFINVFSITYQSPRSVTYDQPGNNNPLEMAQSLPQGSNGVGVNYNGLLISQVLNLDPPTLLRYSGSQVIRVTDQNGRDTRNIQPTPPGGSPSTVTFTARLSNREAGTDPTKVFLQIKDPDSKYQDSQGLEHKVFSGNPRNPNATQMPFMTGGRPMTSGSESRLFGGGSPGFNIVNGAKLDTIGAVGGIDNVNNTDTITVGHDVNGSRASYQSWGPEYECDFVNPMVPNPGTAAGDYGVPYYLAGFDDQTPFGGSTHAPRPTANTTDPMTMKTTTAEWLQMTRLPDAQQDNQGGVLYTATYRTPVSQSDFYLDVIAYDQAVFPNIAPFPAAPPVTSNDFHNQSQNFRIYDNVGGFTTAVFDGSNDILVVSDNALGQKFSATTFGQSQSTNLLPTFYGAESYYTDVDENVLPTAVDHYVTPPGGMPTLMVQKLSVPSSSSFTGAFFSYPDVQNGLGVGSYNDTQTDDGGRVNEPNANLPSLTIDPNTLKPVANPNVPFVRSQKYSLWRILSRGPIPQSVLGGYLPTFQPQPSVMDTTNNVKADAAPNVPIANRCVIWVSPYTGELPLVDAGSLENQTTQDTLTAFVNGGGRLCITGQNVAGAFTIEGSRTSAFLENVLGADFASPAGGSQILAGAGKRISGDSGGGNTYAFLSSGGGLTSVQPSATPLLLSNDLDNLPNWRADASLGQLGPINLNLLNQMPAKEFFSARINTITPFNGSTLDITTSGAPGLVYHENTTSPMGQGFGSRTVFASFGLEGIGIEYQKIVINNVTFFVPHNTRPNILHNIVNYLRTGVFSGRITLASGQGVAGATVYLTSAAPIPGPRQVFSGTTDFGGNYTISGVEPGTYSVASYKSGFTTARSNVTYSVEGDTSQNVGLVIAPVPPGRISGTVTDQSTGKGLGGASVSFTSVDGQVTLTAVTNPDGTYTIDNAPVAAYNGTASKTPQYGSNTPVQGNPITVPSGGTAQADFKLMPKPATVKGVVFNDLNGNGTQDNGEPGVGGATVQLKPTTQGASTPASVTTGSDGSYTVSNLAPGTYTIAVSASGFAPNTSQTVTVAAADNLTRNIPLTAIPPVQNGTLGGLVTDGATGQPVGGITITYTSTTLGATNGTTSTNSSTSSAPDGSGSINYSTGLQPGQYTVSVSASGGFGSLASKTVTVTSNTFSRADFTFPVLHTFQKGKNFFSVPYNYAASGVSFDTLLGGSSNRSHVFVYQPQQLQYVLDPTPPADGLHLGIGYWVNLNNAASVSRTGPSAGAATVAVALHLGWNMIGVPNQNSVAVSSLLFANRTGGGSLTFSEAVSPTYQLISPTLYSYNGTGTTTANAYNAVGSKDSLQTWMGYWIYAYADTTVLIPAG